MWRLLLSSLLVASFCWPASTALAQSAERCHFQLGFAVLHDRLPEVVGSCLEDEQHNPGSGDALQHTTGGLLVWRKADNLTAFTDGQTTWLLGPSGLAERSNGERFPWEANPLGLPLVPSAVAQVPLAPGETPPVRAPSVPPPVSPPLTSIAGIRAVPVELAATQGLAVLPGARLLNLSGDADVLVWVRNSAAVPRSADLVASLLDADGNLLGRATGPISDVQPGQTKLAELTSVAPFSAVAAVRFEVGGVTPGSVTPSLLQLSGVQRDASDARVVLLTLTNTDRAAHTGFISVALTDPAGNLIGVAFGPYNQLGGGQSTTVRCLSLLGPIPEEARLVAQVDTAL